MITVKTRHIGMSQERIHTTFGPGERAAAEELALRINCKPFTPYYAWVEEVAPAPAQNPSDYASFEMRSLQEYQNSKSIGGH